MPALDSDAALARLGDAIARYVRDPVGSVVVMRAAMDYALPREMARVRDVLMPLYQEIGPAGAFALAMMRVDLDRAAKAMIEGDVIAMMKAYQSLKEYKE